MEALLVSNLLLWVLVIALAGVVLALARQVGVLHERLAPVGALALARGPEVGEAAPELLLASLDGGEVAVGGRESDGRSTLLLFVSSSCPVCATLLPTLERVAAVEGPALRCLVASDGDAAEHARFAREKRLDPARYLLSQELGLRFGVSKLPYAVLLDAAGIVRAKGIVNTREHLESLFEARRLGVGSIQEHLAGDAGARPALRGIGGGLDA